MFTMRENFQEARTLETPCPETHGGEAVCVRFLWWALFSRVSRRLMNPCYRGGSSLELHPPNLHFFSGLRLFLEIHSKGMQPFIKLMAPLACPEMPRPGPLELAPRVLWPEFAAAEAAPV